MKENQSWNDEQKFVLKVMKLLDNETHWCKGMWAMTNPQKLVRRAVHPLHERAEAWCLMGAWMMVHGDTVFDSRSIAGRSLSKLAAVLNGEGPQNYNDSPSTSYTDVMRVLTKTLAACGEGETNRRRTA